jgi:hypothetical protein
MDPVSQVFVICLFGAIFVLILASAFSVVHSVRLRILLKRKYYDQWRFVTSVGRWGPGGGNTDRFFRYVFSDQNNDDEEVVRLKDSLKRDIYTFIVFSLTVLVSILLLFLKNFLKLF